MHTSKLNIGISGIQRDQASPHLLLGALLLTLLPLRERLGSLSCVSHSLSFVDSDLSTRSWQKGMVLPCGPSSSLVPKNVREPIWSKIFAAHHKRKFAAYEVRRCVAACATPRSSSASQGYNHLLSNIFPPFSYLP